MTTLGRMMKGWEKPQPKPSLAVFMFSIIKDYLIKHRLPSWTGHMGVIFDDTIEWWGTSHRGVFFDDRFGCSESTLNEIKLLFKKEGVQFRFRGGAYFYIDPDDSQEYIQDPDY